MNPTTDDYQTGALFGSVPNTSALTADMLNPAANGPNDWTTILTNGISGAAVNGINGMVNNAIVSGQIANASAATTLNATAAKANMVPFLMIAAVVFLVMH